jgi:hypothetical protein
VAFTLLAGATAAALILAHYSGFDSWPNLLSGSKGTDAGSASLQSGPADGDSGSFLSLGPGGLPFAPGAGGTATLPPPGVAPGTGLFIADGGGPDGNGEDNGGNGNDGDGGNPGGATTGPGQGGPGSPAGPGAPGGTPQPPSGGEPPGAGPGPGGPGSTPGGGGDDGEEPRPPSQPGGGGDGGCDEGKGQGIAASGFDDGEKWDSGGSGDKDFEDKDFEDKDFEEKDFEEQDFGDKSEKSFELEHEVSEPAYEAGSHEPPADTEAAVSETKEAVPATPVTPAPPEAAAAQDAGPEPIPAPLPTD